MITRVIIRAFGPAASGVLRVHPLVSGDHDMINASLKLGYITRDAEVHNTSGGLKLTFRMAVDRQEAGKRDHFTVVAYGERFLPLAEELRRGTPVLVIGRDRSRDLPDGRHVMYDIVAEGIFPLRELEPGMVSFIIEQVMNHVLREVLILNSVALEARWRLK